MRVRLGKRSLLLARVACEKTEDRTGKNLHPNHDANGENQKQSAVQRMRCARDSPITISHLALMPSCHCHHTSLHRSFIQITRSLAQTADGTDPRPHHCEADMQMKELWAQKLGC